MNKQQTQNNSSRVINTKITTLIKIETFSEKKLNFLMICAKMSLGLVGNP